MGIAAADKHVQTVTSTNYLTNSMKPCPHKPTMINDLIMSSLETEVALLGRLCQFILLHRLTAGSTAISAVGRTHQRKAVGFL